MKTHELKIELSKKLANVNSRIIVIKEKKDDLDEQSETLNNIILELESIRNNILLQFNEIEIADEADASKMPALEKNIYKSFKSFEESFSKAGSITRTTKLRHRERNVNFNNPFETR